jgi:DHA2 family multidrug resistance protein-like MFS transporter
MALCGAGFGLFLSPNARLIVGSAPRERAASAGGLISTTRLMGQTMGATGVAALLALGLGTRPTPAVIAAGLTMVAGALSVARLRPSLRNPRKNEEKLAQPAGHGDVNAV